MNRKFLLVDDDKDDAELFCEAVATIDRSIVCVCPSSGKEALLSLAENRKSLPDLAFFDLNMPQMDGWECLRRLKSDRVLSAIPVIMYSTSSLASYMQAAREQGAVCFFTKPSDYDQLKAVLQVIISALEEGSLGSLETKLAALQRSPQ